MIDKGSKLTRWLYQYSHSYSTTSHYTYPTPIIILYYIKTHKFTPGSAVITSLRGKWIDLNRDTNQWTSFQPTYVTLIKDTLQDGNQCGWFCHPDLSTTLSTYFTVMVQKMCHCSCQQRSLSKGFVYLEVSQDWCNWVILTGQGIRGLFLVGGHQSGWLGFNWWFFYINFHFPHIKL